MSTHRMPPQGTYIRLPTSPSPLGSLEPFEYDEDVITTGRNTSHSSRSLVGVSESNAWKFFIYTCIATLALSAVNISYLSASNTLRTSRTASAAPPSGDLKHPSVYLGLEDVVLEQSYCRSRGTFPKTFFTYDIRDGPRAQPRHVHAPDDKMTLKFGGPVRHCLASPAGCLPNLPPHRLSPDRSAPSSIFTSPTMASRTARSAHAATRLT